VRVINLLEDAHVRRLKMDGKELVAVEVPPADRKQKAGLSERQPAQYVSTPLQR
jgi:hypothetical protein